MTDSKRDASKLRITPNTFILSNAGYKRCHKPGVGNSMQDLFHANQHICHLERSNPEPVFIFEEDAELLAPQGEEALREALREAISLVKRPGVDCVSLRLPPPARARGGVSRIEIVLASSFYWRVGTRATLQCRGPSQIRASPLPKLSSARYVPLYRLLHVLTPARPLAGQLHPRKENSRLWDPTGLGKALIFDPAGCESSAAECYEHFHSHLATNGKGHDAFTTAAWAAVATATAIAVSMS